MTGWVFGWVCSQRKELSQVNIPHPHQWTNSMVRRPKRALKIKCFQTFTLGCNALPLIMKMNAAITFNCSLLLALYWYCVCSWVIYAMKHEFLYTGVWLVYVSINTKLHLYCMFCMPAYAYVYVVCFCVGTWQGEWLAPAHLLAVVYWIMASSPSFCRPLTTLHTP